MDVRVRVGLNLQKARRLRGLSRTRRQDSQTYLSGVELGKRNPSILVLDRIAAALEIDIADLTKK